MEPERQEIRDKPARDLRETAISNEVLALGFIDFQLRMANDLVRRGYSEDEIGKLWGRNFLRVFREVEKVAQQLRVASTRTP